MKRERLRAAVATIICLLGVGLLVWGMWPAPRVTRTLIARPGATFESQFADGRVTEHTGVQGKTEFTITLDFPRQIKARDIEVVRLSVRQRLSLAEDGPSDEIGAEGGTPPLLEQVKGEPLGIQAKLEVVRAVVQPEAEITTVWSADRGAEFLWTLRDLDDATVNGTAWVFLAPFDLPGLTGARMAVSAQPFEIRRATLLGLSGPASRVMGAALVILATILGLPGLELALRRVTGQRIGV